MDKIEGTPFTLVTQQTEEGKYIHFLVMGDQRITEPTETKEDALWKLETEKWMITLHMIVGAVRKTREADKETENYNKQNS